MPPTSDSPATTPADPNFDFLATALLDAGWEDFWLGYDEVTHVYLVTARSSNVVIEGAIHTGLLTFAASGLAHDMSRRLRHELDEANPR